MNAGLRRLQCDDQHETLAIRVSLAVVGMVFIGVVGGVLWRCTLWWSLRWDPRQHSVTGVPGGGSHRDLGQVAFKGGLAYGTLRQA